MSEIFSLIFSLKNAIILKIKAFMVNYYMKTLNNTNNYYKPKQLKLPLEIEKIIEI